MQLLRAKTRVGDASDARLVYVLHKQSAHEEQASVCRSRTCDTQPYSSTGRQTCGRGVPADSWFTKQLESREEGHDWQMQYLLDR